MSLYILLAVLFNCYFVIAQQYGPVPPRLQEFPGANLVSPPRQQFRQGDPRAIPETIQPVNQIPPRSRRPQGFRKTLVQSPQQAILDQSKANQIGDVPGQFTNKVSTASSLSQFQQRASKTLTPRPVVESVNEDVDASLVTTPISSSFPSAVRSNYQQPLPGPPAFVQNPEAAGLQRPPPFIQPAGLRASVSQPNAIAQNSLGQPSQGRQLVRQQVRPINQIPLQDGRAVIPQSVSPQIPETFEEDYYSQVQGRPQKKPELTRQEVVERESLRQVQPLRQPEPIRQQPLRPQQQYLEQPAQRRPQGKPPQKPKKPVAQTIRKYHEENEDGSITWGYENDDGTFKEETIGVDCVTRGKYGYYDPDGVKREYTYQTGIPCVKTAEESEEAASNQGFIDYTNNKYVLPNGDEIDLEAMVKNRARKPYQKYRA